MDRLTYDERVVALQEHFTKKDYFKLVELAFCDFTIKDLHALQQSDSSYLTFLKRLANAFTHGVLDGNNVLVESWLVYLCENEVLIDQEGEYSVNSPDHWIVEND